MFRKNVWWISDAAALAADIIKKIESGDTAFAVRIANRIIGNSRLIQRSIRIAVATNLFMAGLVVWQLYLLAYFIPERDVANCLNKQEVLEQHSIFDRSRILKIGVPVLPGNIPAGLICAWDVEGSSENLEKAIRFYQGHFDKLFKELPERK